MRNCLESKQEERPEKSPEASAAGDLCNDGKEMVGKQMAAARKKARPARQRKAGSGCPISHPRATVTTQGE